MPQHPGDRRLGRRSLQGRHKFAESARPDVVRETPDSSGTVIPCHEFETVDVPPAECLQELSLMEPGAIVKCTFWEPFGGNRGFLAYRDGELWESKLEHFVVEKLRSASQPV